MTKVSKLARVGIAAAAAATVGLAPVPMQSADASNARVAATPTITVVASASGLDVSGPLRFRAGWVKLNVSGGAVGADMELVRYRGDYTFHDMKSDIGKVFVNNDLAALNRMIRHTRFYGAPNADVGETTHGWSRLGTADTYVLFQFGETGPENPTRLHVFGTIAHRARPSYSATVFAKEQRRWGGDTELPADGAIRFINRADYSPHFVALQHVAKDTTRREVIQCLQDENCTFDFGRPGSADTGSLSPGHRFVFKYDLPPGTYALMCFFPDPETGMPHALMGMVRIVHLH